MSDSQKRVFYIDQSGHKVDAFTPDAAAFAFGMDQAIVRQLEQSFPQGKRAPEAATMLKSSARRDRSCMWVIQSGG